MGGSVRDEEVGVKTTLFSFDLAILCLKLQKNKLVVILIRSY